jgi:hypothetical protein
MGIPSRAARVVFPLTERTFTYERYDRVLERLVAGGFRVVPLEELRAADRSGAPVVGLRHDVDESLESALELARLEHARGLRATYFVLHTAAYWSDPALIPSLRRLQDDYGHEVGWHNDLVTLQCIHGVDAKAYLARELERLRGAGIAVRGVASHGSPYCYRFGYHNNYFFSDFDDVVPGFPNTRIVPAPQGPCEIPRAALVDFGLEYEAYYLDNDLYFSDSSFTNGRRWHPDELDLTLISPGQKAVILIHPCHWDASASAKVIRLARMLRAGKWRAPDALP